MATPNKPRNPYGRYEPRQIASGKWRVQVPTGTMTADGNPAFKWFTRDTKRAARDARDAYLAERAKGVTPPRDSLTLAKFLDIWLDATAPTVRPGTLAGYRLIARKHLVPALGRRPLTKLAPYDVAAFYADLATRRAPQTVLNVHHVLHRALGWAVRQGLLSRNVAALADRPAVPRYEARALTIPEARALLAASEGARLGLLVRLALYTGLRQGELLGLRWADLDLEAGVAHVRQALKRDGGRSAVGPTKTHRSRRPVPLTPDLVRLLQDHGAIQRAERPLRDNWEDHDLVFCTRRGTPIAASNLRNRDYQALLEAAEIPKPWPRFHDLRHTVGTHTFRGRPNPKAVSDLLGHSRTSITLDLYAGTVSDETRAAAEEWTRLLQGDGAP